MKIMKSFTLLTLLLAGTLVFSCGKKEEKNAENEQVENNQEVTSPNEVKKSLQEQMQGAWAVGEGEGGDVYFVEGDKFNARYLAEQEAGPAQLLFEADNIVNIKTERFGDRKVKVLEISADKITVEDIASKTKEVWVRSAE